MTMKEKVVKDADTNTEKNGSILALNVRSVTQINIYEGSRICVSK